MAALKKKNEEFYFDIPAVIYYRTPNPVPIRELVDSLTAVEKITWRLPKLLTLLGNQKVIKTELLVNEIQSGSLWEDFVIRAFFGSLAEMMAFADIFNDWINGAGVMEPSILGGALLGAVVTYGAIKAKAIWQGKTAKNANHIEIKNNVVIAASAEQLGVTAEAFSDILQQSLGASRALANESIAVIKPARQKGASGISFGGKGTNIPELSSSEIRGIPVELDNEDRLTQRQHFDVDLDIRRINRDGEQGWEAVMPPHITRRLPLRFGEGVSYLDLDGKYEVRADVIVHLKPAGKSGVPTPFEIELIGLVEE